MTFGRIVFVFGGAISILLLLFSICENEKAEVKIKIMLKNFSLIIKTNISKQKLFQLFN